VLDIKANKHGLAVRVIGRTKVNASEKTGALNMEKDAFASLWCVSDQCNLFLKQSLKKRIKHFLFLIKITFALDLKQKFSPTKTFCHGNLEKNPVCPFGHHRTWPTGRRLFYQSTFEYERSIDINASKEVVFNIVNDLKTQETWGPWAKEDPTIKNTYNEVVSGSWARKAAGPRKAPATAAADHHRVHTSYFREGKGRVRGPRRWRWLVQARRRCQRGHQDLLGHGLRRTLAIPIFLPPCLLAR
jgi:hypothetical protein